MRTTRRPSTRQGVLFPEDASDDVPRAELNRDLLEAIADLLLETLRGPSRAEGGVDESEDHT
jgi:hypothetical protein